MASRTSSLLFLLLLLSPLLVTSHSSPSSFSDLDPSEILALGLEDDLPSDPDFHNFDSNDEPFPSGIDDSGFADDTDDDLYRFSIDDPDVVILSSHNFSDFVTSNKFVMVEFYAPWCGHCQALAPEYAVAATELKSEGVHLAKVDATKEAELAEQYDVQGYPTMMFFINGKPKPYSHHRTSDAIVAWIKKNIGPAVSEISNLDDAQKILETGNSIVLAVFGKFEGNEVEEYASAAQMEDDLTFYHTTSREVAEVFHLKRDVVVPALVLVKKDSEGFVPYYGKFESSSISEFIVANKLPLVSNFTRDTATAIFESLIKEKILLFASPEDAKGILPSYEEAAKYFRGKVIFAYVDSSDEDIGKPIADFFGITLQKPKALAFTVTDESPVKYLFEDEFSLDKIKVFVASFLDGKLEAFYKSEPLPETNEGDVKVVVGRNFDAIVLDESKDVLLEIYAPWCGHCQALEGVYNKLGKALSGVKSLVIAKMDGTANEHPRGKADGYPTLLLFPAGNKSADPIVVDSERSVKDLYLFLKNNVAIPFSLAKSSDDRKDEL